MATETKTLKKSDFPGGRRATELPVVSWNDWDNVQRVKAAIRSHELGNFSQSAAVVEAMGRDDRITGCLETRGDALPGLPLYLEPRGDGRQKRAVAKECDEKFEEMFPDAVLSEMMCGGVMQGFTLAENLWARKEGRWDLTLKVWHHKFVRVDPMTRQFIVQTAEGDRVVTPGDGQWVLFLPFGKRGWMKGKVRSLYVPWLIRTWGLRDWARHSEVHGHPIKKIVTPPGAEEEDKQKFLREVAALGTEPTIRTPRVSSTGNPEADRYDIELLEAQSNSWETFDKLLAKAESSVAIALLGQNLTTEVKGGSYAAAQAHMQIRNDILQSDAERLGQCLREQCLSWWAMLNFGSAELAPMPKWKTKNKTPEERTAKGTALKNLGEGLNTMRQAGVKLDVDKIIEEEDIPTTGPSEELDREALMPIPAPGTTPKGAQPEVRPGGKPALPRPKAEASQEVRGADGVIGYAKVKAAQDDDVPAAAIEGQSYIDALGDDGTLRLGAAFRKDLNKVLELIADGPDFETLRRRLLEAYGDMDSEEEAELLRKGMEMAELAGRFAARKEAGLPVEPQEDVDAD